MEENYEKEINVYKISSFLDGGCDRNYGDWLRHKRTDWQ